MKKLFLLNISLLVVLTLSAQGYYPFEQVKKYTSQQPASKYDSSSRLLKNRLGIGIHYLYPFYQAIGMEKKFKETMGESSYNSSFSEMLSFVGDYSKALEYQQKNYQVLHRDLMDALEDSIHRLKNIQYVPAGESIIANASHYRVIMINESHAKPLHRAFTYSLLDNLYKDGYRYLAMEAFNNLSNKCLDSLNVFTGYYTYEPVAGEMVRKALELGYTLIAYEDTLATEHSPSQRDSVQAVHLWNVLKKDPSAKMIVHAGLNHIAEEKSDDFTPMGAWFRKLSGVDPFTIDQTGMTEGSEFAYGKWFYQHFLSRFKIQTPSVIFHNKRLFNPLEEIGYDMIVMHPATTYRNNRPDWLTLNGDRKLTLIQPTEKLLFLVQAYYENEYDPETLPYKVPADQTYATNSNGYYPLYLRKGKYRIVLRDVSYKILSTKELQVE